jgi:uncharacterized membrane protein YfcA
MIFLLVFAVCFCSCIVGAICGIGGGVIIKPALDAFGIMDVATISFLSGCTVLSMTTYSVVRSKLSGSSRIDSFTGVPLALGAAIGGVLGKNMFQAIRDMSGDANLVGAIQAGCLLVVTVGTLVYTLLKSRIPTHRVKNRLVCVAIGLVLGVMSSFLGIGGGPINLVVLYFFFSMETKIAAQNSLYIIFFSQLASLLFTLISGKVPDFPVGLFACMVGCGILGGVVGRKINKKIASQTVSKLFLGLMVIIMGICCYNFYQYC